MAAGQDAGNRLMREGRRTKWAVKDWNAACETFERLWGRPDGQTEAENVSQPAYGAAISPQTAIADD